MASSDENHTGVWQLSLLAQPGPAKDAKDPLRPPLPSHLLHLPYGNRPPPRSPGSWGDQAHSC